MAFHYTQFKLTLSMDIQILCPVTDCLKWMDTRKIIYDRNKLTGVVTL